MCVDFALETGARTGICSSESFPGRRGSSEKIIVCTFERRTDNRFSSRRVDPIDKGLSMARAKSVKSEEVSKPAEPGGRSNKRAAPAAPADAAPKRSPWWVHVTFGVILLALVVTGIYRARAFADDKLARSAAPAHLVFLNKPEWMNADLIARITEAVSPVSSTSSLDHKVLVDTADMLRAHPWVRSVKQVRRVYGAGPGDTIEVDCEFRTPVALVQDDRVYWMVDGDGVKLPEKFTSDELGKLGLGLEPKRQLRRIIGVDARSPQAGEIWPGEDLRAGLDLVKLMHDKPYLNEIVEVDVMNFAARVDTNAAQLVLRTFRGSEVRWGQPIDATRFYREPTTDEKLRTLERIYAQYDRVDAGSTVGIDVRFDQFRWLTDQNKTVRVQE
jgi:hypothetical protein